MIGFLNKLSKDKLAFFNIAILVTTIVLGIFAPFVALHDPNAVDVMNKYAKPSWEYPFGTDSLGRCIFSRIIFGIRTTVFYAILTMAITILIGTILGILSGYFRGWIDELMMRICDIMLSFPSQVMILAIVGLLGPGIFNVIIANVVVKWAWYTRMIRTITLKISDANYVLYSRAIGTKTSFILSKHITPSIISQIVVLATLDVGWVIINISALSFLGLGVQAPTPEWGSMLSEARTVMFTDPIQMLMPGLAILIVVASFNYLGDKIRDALDVKNS